MVCISEFSTINVEEHYLLQCMHVCMYVYMNAHVCMYVCTLRGNQSLLNVWYFLISMQIVMYLTI